MFSFVSCLLIQIPKLSVQFSSVAHRVWLFMTPGVDCSTPGLPVHCQLPESTQAHAHWVSDAIQSSHPLSSPSPPTFSLSQHQGLFKCQLFISGGQSIGVSASTSVLPMNIQDWFPLEFTGFDLLAVQVTLKSLLQHHSSKASILWYSAFFIVQLSHPYETTGRNHSLD